MTTTVSVEPPPSAPAHGTVRLTTAQALVRFLQVQYSERDGRRRRLVPALCGIFGHGNVAGLGQALQEHGAELPFLQPKNEQGMVHAALGYAKATRRLATLACSASIGPGSTNMLTGAATATTNRLPVLLLPSDTFANRRQGPVLQQLEHPLEADTTVNDAFRPLSRFFDRIARPEQLLTALPEAMRVLVDPAETGAVTIALHQDVQGEAFDFPAELLHERVWRVARRPPAAEELARAAALLRGARRPLIVAGGGAIYSEAGEELAALAGRLGAPVAETSAGKGAMAPDELLLGGLGVNGTGAANEIARRADVVLCVGTRLSDFTTASHSLFQAPDVRFVGVNVCAADAHKLGAAPVVADARLALAALAEALEGAGAEPGYREEVARAKAEWDAAVTADLAPREGERTSQGEVYRAVNETARAGDWVVAAAGSPPGDLLKLWEVVPGSFAHLEFAFSCMGHEIPAGLGIRMARPDAGEVLVVIGDGTYLMANTELVTAVQEQLKITVVLLVNHGYQSIHTLQRATTGRSFGNEFRARRAGDPGLDGPVVDVDYVVNARSLGCRAERADTVEELRAALDRAREHQGGPSLIACHVEPHRGVLGGGAFWDLGVAQASADEAVRRLAAEHGRRAREQRAYL
jgi:3D-(3,5/4)-trihydroxycyclohexane-1,2-dione acylhydrolase (decyclizing)